MRHIRIYQEGPFETGQIIELSPEAGQHVGVVLRMQPQDELTLFCNDNHEYQAQIIAAHKKKVTVRITQTTLVNRESPCHIHLAQGISKGDRMEWVIQKAVELGVSAITPLITAHCAVRLDESRLAKKQQQWQAIAIGACEQSGRNRVPIVHDAVTFDTFIERHLTSLNVILHPRAHHSLNDIPNDQKDITLLIGPEGGLSDLEIQHAQSHDYQAVTLGPRILRTETAAITALSILQAKLGDL